VDYRIAIAKTLGPVTHEGTHSSVVTATIRGRSLMRRSSSAATISIESRCRAMEIRMTTTAAADTDPSGVVLALGLSRETRAACGLSAAALLWSGAFIASRALRHDVDPVMMTMLRWGVALVFVLPFVGRSLWRQRAVVAREWRLVVALGCSGLAGFHTLTNLALQTTAAFNALLMLSLSPATVLIASAALGTSRSSRLQWSGTVVSLVGACVLVTHGKLDVLLELDFARGDLWMLVGVGLWTAYSMLLKRRPSDLPADVALAASIVPALAVLLAVALLTGASQLPAPTPLVVGAVLYLAVFASLAAFSLWGYGVATLGPERAASYVHLMPAFGAVLSFVLLGEVVVPAQLAGGALVLAGIVLVSGRLRPARAACDPPTALKQGLL